MNKETRKNKNVEEDPQPFWMYATKFWPPVFLFLTVLTNLDHPIALQLKLFYSSQHKAQEVIFQLACIWERILLVSMR